VTKFEAPEKFSSVSGEAQQAREGNAKVERLYSDWLKARAAVAAMSGEDDDENDRLQSREDEAGQSLLMARAYDAETILKKWAALDFCIDKERVGLRHSSPRLDNLIFSALASIKADVLRFI